jgi:hypothetical protein
VLGKQPTLQEPTHGASGVHAMLITDHLHRKRRTASGTSPFGSNRWMRPPRELDQQGGCRRRKAGPSPPPCLPELGADLVAALASLQNQ